MNRKQWKNFMWVFLFLGLYFTFQAFWWAGICTSDEVFCSIKEQSYIVPGFILLGLAWIFWNNSELEKKNE